MTSRIVDELEPDERCDKKRIEKQGGVGWSAWSSRNGLLVEREKRGRAAFCCGLVYQSPAPAAARSSRTFLALSSQPANQPTNTRVSYFRTSNNFYKEVLSC